MRQESSVLLPGFGVAFRCEIRPQDTVPLRLVGFLRSRVRTTRGAWFPVALPITTITPPLFRRASGQKSPNWDGTQQHPACDSPRQDRVVSEVTQALGDAKTTSRRPSSRRVIPTPVVAIPATP